MVCLIVYLKKKTQLIELLYIKVNINKIMYSITLKTYLNKT